MCGDTGRTGNRDRLTAEALKEFVGETLKDDGNGNWPTSTVTKNGKKEKAEKTNDNAEAVAKDLTKLTTEEKTIVAGLLAKTIEGGEVVEIRAVSSTFSMVNLGYRYWGFIVIGSLTMQSSEVTFEYSVKYKYAYYI
ncbi:hypothetical protein ANAPC1_01046 [Anaplasma phagocytophilum]|uniref:Uncharacterized protein n=1 Tax=Anaplasma phagocytophilum TaxID=948 RepID=A0AA45ZHZ0_ANAPH|nr:hypothetical protein [Anaplasma phagocytophilum]SBO14683.1 hypothetical protein ANAPC1_01046 [Anaplasma phagocytophilum]